MATTVSMTNIAANNGKGWFPATRGNCTWQLSPLTPGDGAGSSIKIIPSGAGEVTLTSAAHGLVASHKYYITFKVMYESAANCTFDWYWPVAEPSAAAGMRVNAAANTWHRVSAVFDRTSFRMAAIRAGLITIMMAGQTSRSGLHRACWLILRRRLVLGRSQAKIGWTST